MALKITNEIIIKDDGDTLPPLTVLQEIAEDALTQGLAHLDQKEKEAVSYVTTAVTKIGLAQQS